MITAIILAAGSARRMGRQKLLLPYRGATLIEHIVGEVLQSGVEACLVVTGCDSEYVGPLVSVKGARQVHNPHHQTGGMLSSVRQGLTEASDATTAFMVFLGDQPGISSGFIRVFLDFVESHSTRICVPMFQGKRGHPLYFKSDYKADVMQRYDDIGLKGLLRDHEQDVTQWSCEDPNILVDLDTPEDYTKWMSKHSNLGQ